MHTQRRMLMLSLISAALLVGPVLATDPAGQATDLSVALRQVVERPQIQGTFEAALGEIGKLAAAPVAVDWTALEAAGVKADQKVSVKARKATVEQLLELVLVQVASEESPLAWRIEAGRIVVTTQRQAVRSPRGRAAARFTQLAGPSARPALQPAAPSPGPTTRPVRVRPPYRSIEFDKLPLKDVVDFFRMESALDYHVNWRSLEAVGIERSTPVTLQASRISLAKALDLVTEEVSGPLGKLDRVYWVNDGGIIKIATGTALDRNLQVRVFDVADLLMVVPNFQTGQLGLGAIQGRTSGTGVSDSVSGGTSFGRAPTGGTRGQDRQQVEQDLIDVIKNAIGEDMWQPIGKGSIKIVRGQMVISQTLLGFALLERAASR